MDAVRKLVLWELLCAPWDHDVWEQEYVYSKCGERPHALAITMKAAKEQGFCWGMFDDSIARHASRASAEERTGTAGRRRGSVSVKAISSPPL